MTDIRRIRKAAGCTLLCSLSEVYRILHTATRYTHNGERFSHAVDFDEYVGPRLSDGGVDLLARWCREHHAGRSGHEITIERDGRTQTVLMPEAGG